VADEDGNPVEVAFARANRYLIKPPKWSFKWPYSVVEVTRDEPSGVLKLVFGEPMDYADETRVPVFADPATDRAVTIDTSVLIEGLRPAKFRPDDALFVSAALTLETALYRTLMERREGRGARSRGASWSLSTPVPLDGTVEAWYSTMAFNMPSDNPHVLSRTDLLCAATAAYYKVPMYTTKPEAYVGAGQGLKTLKYGPVRNEDADPVIPEPPERLRPAPLPELDARTLAWITPGYPDRRPEFRPQAEAAAEDAAPGQSRVARIDAGALVSMALDAAGRVYLWGSEGMEKPGGGSKFFWTPYQVLLFQDGDRFAKISAGWHKLAALTTDGRLYLWNRLMLERMRQERPYPDRLRLEPVRFPCRARIKDVSSGAAHILALAEDGSVYAIGHNREGQLGDGTQDSAREPVRVTGLPEGERITRVAAAGGHSVALTETGRLWAWGSNSHGQLGDGTDQNRATPVPATGYPQGDPIIEAHPSIMSTTVVTASGKVYLAGSLGTPPKEPDPKPGLRHVARFGQFPKDTRIATMSAGDDHWLAVAEDGALYAWGYNEFHKLGVDAQVKFATRPIRVTGFPEDLRITQVAAGGHHSLALADDGSMCAWGSNNNGELGTGLQAPDRRHPAKIPWVE
jgi:alpha-tubulin suppressor-like RCC1 family protein